MPSSCSWRLTLLSSTCALARRSSSRNCTCARRASRLTPSETQRESRRENAWRRLHQTALENSRAAGIKVPATLTEERPAPAPATVPAELRSAAAPTAVPVSSDVLRSLGAPVSAMSTSATVLHGLDQQGGQAATRLPLNLGN